ncbi:hypothetical protein [Klebsiella pneumoniae]|uniref:hypothetical protein n=1 Tax=Klebsiella pneumoniae TaxID=573 RepID=UPI00396F2AAC
MREALKTASAIGAHRRSRTGKISGRTAMQVPPRDRLRPGCCTKLAPLAAIVPPQGASCGTS